MVWDQWWFKQSGSKGLCWRWPACGEDPVLCIPTQPWSCWSFQGWVRQISKLDYQYFILTINILYWLSISNIDSQYLTLTLNILYWLLISKIDYQYPTFNIWYRLNDRYLADPLLQAFHRYALNYINALNYLETLRRHQEFSEFEKVRLEVARSVGIAVSYCQWCNKDPRCKKLQLTDLLVSPVHHIMKVPLLLKEEWSTAEVWDSLRDIT